MVLLQLKTLMSNWLKILHYMPELKFHLWLLSGEALQLKKLSNSQENSNLCNNGSIMKHLKLYLTLRIFMIKLLLKLDMMILLLFLVKKHCKNYMILNCFWQGLVLWDVNILNYLHCQAQVQVKQEMCFWLMMT